MQYCFFPQRLKEQLLVSKVMQCLKNIISVDLFLLNMIIILAVKLNR